ncbi:type II toxin-antitoxin system RelE/ParE family toxin [Marinospirillum sp.]|uniref:type II toxin-antitoxin system RelE/ParE family toxin n=1 Tax=Marinospirillum sp. TaxID=2183934 RepID=UPI002870ABDE|nr:type II toxin-antitoxin system RelE/ParE family toxin [Marinospirillum sp.]MDR9469226.1 type II toxin-antitoxin system RelE/ParE family toxin [Marinospirillum sp.]
MSYWLHPDAEAELGDAAVYYAEHASLRIAEAFLAEFEYARDLLIDNPSIGAVNDLGLCSFHFKRFPYTIIYQKDSEGPQIFAIAHQHRRPGYWLERL